MCNDISRSYLAQDLKKEFAGEIFMAGVVHEECFEGVAAREISNYVNPDIVNNWRSISIKS